MPDPHSWLLSEELDALLHYENLSAIPEDEPTLSKLCAMGLVDARPVGSDGMFGGLSTVYTVSRRGKLVLQSIRDGRCRDRRATLRYWITTGISLLALAVSITALIVSLTRQ